MSPNKNAGSKLADIDSYPRRVYEALYDTGEEVFYQNARTIDPNTLPDLDLICGGFPCQSFSITGGRGGFADTRGTLFFEIAWLAGAKKPRNSYDNGSTQYCSIKCPRSSSPTSSRNLLSESYIAPKTK